MVNDDSPTGDALDVFPTDLGWMAVVVREGAVRRLVFGYSTPDETMRALAEPDLPVQRSGARVPRTLVARLRAFARGKPDEFRDVKLHLPMTTGFSQRVVAACRRIPWGKTKNYGELAAAAGSPRAARAVGNVMRSNTIPILIPCHRVLASAGRLGGYSHPLGVEIKQRLLALESAARPRSRAPSSKAKGPSRSRSCN